MRRTEVRVRTMPVMRIWTGREVANGGRSARIGSNAKLLLDEGLSTVNPAHMDIIPSILTRRFGYNQVNP